MSKRGGFLFFAVFVFIWIIPSPIFSQIFVSSQPTGFTFYSEGDISLSVTLSQLIVVLRDNFDGLTTDFAAEGNAGIQNLQFMTLERLTYGSIVFNQNINLTTDAYSPTGGVYDRVVDIDSNLQISDNFISVNHAKLGSLNKSANISLSRLSVGSPQIMRNGVKCPTSICTIISHSGGTVTFKVAYFQHSSTITTYSVAEEQVSFCGDDVCDEGETCSSCDEDCGECAGGGGGGGGGGGTIGGRNITVPNVTGKYSFYVEPEEISTEIEKGKSYLQQVRVYNTGTEDLSISVSSSSSILQFMKLDEKVFHLKSGESKVYSFYTYSSTRVKANLYTGRLLFSAQRASDSVDLAITVQELPVLFDIKINTIKKFVVPEGIATAEIKFANIGDAEYVDAVLEYGIMDFNNIVYISRTENITVGRDLLTQKVSLKLPPELDVGKYLFYTKISYEDKISISSDTFHIEKISIVLWIISLILISILIFLVIFAIWVIKRRRKEEERKRAELKEKGFSEEEIMREEKPVKEKVFFKGERPGKIKSFIKKAIKELKDMT